MRAEHWARVSARRVSRPLRVAVGALWQETNAFNPRSTALTDFDIQTGAEGLKAILATHTALAGMLTRLDEAGVETRFTLSARARPGGAVEDFAAETLVDRLCDGIVASAPDAVCLELHGSMVATSHDDVEGWLLERLRARLPKGTPVVVGLDLHAHLTPEMVAHATFLTGYRTQPHIDMFETGVRAAAALLAIVENGLAVVSHLEKVPFLALTNDETGTGPMAEVLAVRDAHPGYANPELVDVSIFNVHPFLDLPGMGQAVLAYGLSSSIAEAISVDIASALRQRAERFTETKQDLSQLATLAASARKAGKVLVVGDEGDSVLAGTPGDSFAIAYHLLDTAPELRALVPIFAPDVVALAKTIGGASTITVDLGGLISPGLERRAVTAKIVALTDGRFTNRGHYMRGASNSLGDSAVLKVGAMTVLATSREPSAVDPEMIRHAGASLDDIDILVVKSSNHYRLSFDDSFLCATLATAGLSCRTAGLLMHSRARPIFPIDRVNFVDSSGSSR
tara:strand:+ start:8745 stop:10277 length:1533 start_codon:yes stop_codon:yes gene_type:complete